MNDPYTKMSQCVNRLYKEYSRHPRLIVAVDFDDTVYPYHNKNETHERVLNVLKKYHIVHLSLLVDHLCMHFEHIVKYHLIVFQKDL